MTEAIPYGVSFVAAEAARDTVGGAAAAIAELPVELGASLLEGARAAFALGVFMASLNSTCSARTTTIFQLTWPPTS
jgi:MFS transporter, DHA2 family, multidrug resistance protein